MRIQILSSSQTNSITFAATLNTTELTKGRESILDAISRLEKIATVFEID